MAWLAAHNILHSYLKPANILLNKNLNCKICDFGLSQVTKNRKKIQDQTKAPGSVLWMAPEVLLGEKIDEKLDVYAFALVFWEILTRKELFPQYNDKDIFREDIAIKGIRPPLDDIDPVLCKILVQCWDRNPDLRPSFEQLLPLLEKALIDIYLPLDLCPLAPVFWQMNFKYQARVPIDDFVYKFIRTLIVVTDKSPIKIEEESLKMLLEEEEGNEKVVSIERFSALLTWFGPMKQPNRMTILHQIITVLSSPWFFGKYTLQQSERHIALLASKPRGLFLVRLNMGERIPTNKAPFTITRVDDQGNVVQTRVYRFKNEFIIKPTEDQKIIGRENSISDFIGMLMKNTLGLLTVPCPGSPFEVIFKSKPKHAYQELNLEELTF